MRHVAGILEQMDYRVDIGISYIVPVHIGNAHDEASKHTHYLLATLTTHQYMYTSLETFLPPSDEKPKS